MPCTNTGPITYLAAHLPRTGMRGPSHTCRIRTCVPPRPRAGIKLHSTSMPFVTPPTCRKRIDGSDLFTDISDSHHVGQLKRSGTLDVSMMWKGREADISTSPPPSDRLSLNRTYL